MGGYNAEFCFPLCREHSQGILFCEGKIVKLIDEAIHLANKGILSEAAEHAEMTGMGTTILVTTV